MGHGNIFSIQYPFVYWKFYSQFGLIIVYPLSSSTPLFFLEKNSLFWVVKFNGFHHHVSSPSHTLLVLVKIHHILEFLVNLTWNYHLMIVLIQRLRLKKFWVWWRWLFQSLLESYQHWEGWLHGVFPSRCKCLSIFRFAVIFTCNDDLNYPSCQMFFN